MQNAKNYFKLDGENKKFELPLSTWEKLKLYFIIIFLQKLPFVDSLYFDSTEESIYWSIIKKYIIDKFSVKIYNRPIYFKNRFIFNSVNVRLDEKDNYLNGHGASFESDEIGLSKSIGEFLERFATSNPTEEEKKNFKFLNSEQLESQVELPYKYHNYFKKLHPQKVFESVELEEINSGKKVYYPRQLVFWKQFENLKKEDFIIDNTTSGCAGGFSITESTVSAIRELVERDSFCCYWLTQTAPDIIEIPPNKFPVYDKVKKILNDCDCEIYVLDTTTNLNIPAVVVTVIDKNTGAVCISAGCSTTYSNAISGAVEEVAACLPIFDSDKNYELEKEYIPFSDKNLGRDERLLVWKSGKYLDKIKFFISGKKVVFKDVEENIDNQYEYLIQKLKNMGEGYDNVYRYVSSSKELKDLNYFVVSIIIPKLLPLYLIEANAITKSKRLEEFNLWKNKTGEFEINTFPHPFP